MDASQFHYGSIEIFSSRSSWEYDVGESQFHYGSIEIDNVPDWIKNSFWWSQFHYGSIEIQTQNKMKYYDEIRLNSIMVRLKF